jgi:hypothetical protein
MCGLCLPNTVLQTAPQIECLAGTARFVSHPSSRLIAAHRINTKKYKWYYFLPIKSAAVWPQPHLTLDRLTTCATIAETKINYRSIRMMIANSIHYVMHVQQDLHTGARRMAAFVKVEKYNLPQDTFASLASPDQS